MLRIPHLSGSFWLDEAAQALEIVRPLSQQLQIIDDFQPPLLHLILHFAQYISRTEEWLRTIGALIPGIITIFYSFKIAKKIFNNNVALISSLLLATSQFHIFYSQELRPYSLSAMIALMSIYYLLEFTSQNAADKLTTKNNDASKIKKSNIPLIITNLLGLYSTYLFPFVIIGQFFYILFLKKDYLKKYLQATFISLLGFSIWLPTFFKQLNAGQSVRIDLPGWENVVSFSQLKSLPLVLAKFIFGNLNIEANIFFISFSILIIIPLFYLLISKIKNIAKNNKVTGSAKAAALEQNAKLHFLLIWLIVPSLSAWLISFYVPIVSPKRLLFLLPVFYILVAYLSDYYETNKNITKKRLSKLLVWSLLTVNVISCLNYYFDTKIQRENWRDLDLYISQNYLPSNTIIIYSFTDEFAPMKWYDQSNLPFIQTGKLSIDNVDDLANKLKIVVEYDNVLVFDYLRDLTDPNKKIDNELKKFGLEEAGVIDYPNIGFVRIFSKPHALVGIKY